MKKLMIAVAIVCAAAMTQAASFKWQSKSTGTGSVIWDGTAENKAYATYGGVTLYLFDAATYSQAQAFADLTGKGLNTSKSIENTTINSSSKITGKTFDYADAVAGNYYDFYFAAVFDDDPKTFMISSLKEDAMAQPSSTTTLQWDDPADYTKTTLDASAGLKGAGVYAAAVPEPTSGLLLLLGIAGMALRRRRA